VQTAATKTRNAHPGERTHRPMARIGTLLCDIRWWPASTIPGFLVRGADVTRQLAPVDADSAPAEGTGSAQSVASTASTSAAPPSSVASFAARERAFSPNAGSPTSFATAAATLLGLVTMVPTPSSSTRRPCHT
jgi:hypothetical protein